jgi:hypothetical protein
MKMPHQSVIALAIGLFATVAPAVRGADPQPHEGREFLETLAAQIAAFERGSIRADVEMSFFRSLEDATPMRGAFEFDASGEKWRKRSVVEPGRAMSMDTEIAYDGETYQYADRTAGLLSIARGTDQRNRGMALPNPLVLMGQWLVPRHDEDPQDVTLGMLRNAAESFDIERVRWEKREGEVFGILPGAASSFGDYDVRITPPREGEAAIIELMVCDSGEAFSRTRLSDWRDVAGKRWPHRLDIDLVDPVKSQPVGVMRMTITSLTHDEPGDVFTLDRDAFGRVWSDEARLFVKGAPAVSGRPASLLDDLTNRWRAAPEHVDLIATLAAVDHEVSPDDSFRFYHLGERAYARQVKGKSRLEREAFDGLLFDDVRDKRLVILEAIRGAVDAARAGDSNVALRALDTLDRVAEVSARDGELEVARMVAIRLKEQVAEARAEIAKLPH